MADQVLQGPTKTDRAAMRWRTRLDGRFYEFRLMWNVRMRTWFLDIAQSDGTPLVNAHRAAIGVDVTAPYNDARLPVGQLFFLDSEGQGVEAGRNDLQGRSPLVYRPLADVALAAGTADEIF